METEPAARAVAAIQQGLAVGVQDRLGLDMGEVVIQEIAPGQRDVHGIRVDTCSRVMGLAKARLGNFALSRGVDEGQPPSLPDLPGNLLPPLPHEGSQPLIILMLPSEI